MDIIECGSLTIFYGGKPKICYKMPWYYHPSQSALPCLRFCALWQCSHNQVLARGIVHPTILHYVNLLLIQAKSLEGSFVFKIIIFWWDHWIVRMEKDTIFGSGFSYDLFAPMTVTTLVSDYSLRSFYRHV
jgi:hypothetical protein